jgi:SnoaL-like domain
MSSTRNVADNLADHLAIRSLMDRYTDGVNRRDWAAVERVFAANGVWDCGGPAAGPMAFRFEGAKACAQGIGAMVSATPLVIQSNHAPVIHVEGDRATASSTVNEVVLAPGAAQGTTIWGMYFDTIQKDADGEWRFTERRFRFAWVDAAANAGQVLAQPPQPTP